MRKLILIVLFLLLAFYVAWPMWSGYRIHSALERGDAAALEGKVDIDQLRISLRPSVLATVEKSIERAAGGLGQVLGGGLKQQLGPQLADAALKSLVTPDNLVKLYARRGDIREMIEEVAQRRGGSPVRTVETTTAPPKPAAGGPVRTIEQDGKAVAQPSSGGERTPHKMGLANIKRLAFTGPLGFEVGFAKDPAASEPDLTAQLGFSGLDWKLVGLIPRPR